MPDWYTGVDPSVGLLGSNSCVSHACCRLFFALCYVCVRVCVCLQCVSVCVCACMRVCMCVSQHSQVARASAWKSKGSRVDVRLSQFGVVVVSLIKKLYLCCSSPSSCILWTWCHLEKQPIQL